MFGPLLTVFGEEGVFVKPEAGAFPLHGEPRVPVRVESETAEFLNGYTPAGLELAVAEMAMPAPSRTIPPPGATPPPAMTPELMRRYGMENAPGPNPLAPGNR